MMLALLLAITGAVFNATTGEVQPNATVTLYRLSREAGLESVESVKSGPGGRFEIRQEIAGPRLLQTAWDGVTYNHMLPPGASTADLRLEVFNASRDSGAAAVSQHMMLFELSKGDLQVSDTYVFQNSGKITWNDPASGALKFFLPPGARDATVNATAPQGMPIRRAPEKTAAANVHMVDFPIKPGETRIDVTYSLAFGPGSTFEGRRLFPGKGPTRLIAPAGVTLKGDLVESLGQEPRTQATIYDVKGSPFRVTIEGSGMLRPPAGPESGAPEISEIMPRLYGSIDGSASTLDKMWAAKWVLVLLFGILTLGFLLLYRAQSAEVRTSGRGQS
ncbi:MAG: hypothetical protein FJW37_12945 [Acidobacteria bacterium]|nr:hypothetical protein [Acidobacteriota bacterium]